MKTQKAFFGLPSQVKFCKNCVISNQRPNSTVEMKNKNIKKETIEFDKEGVCSACNYSKKKTKEIKWKDREKKLFELLEPYRSRNGEYDVLVPSSGGKDSSFTAHILKYKYKMNPLTITWAPNIFTRAGWNNFNSLAKEGGVDSILYTPNGKLHSYLTRLSFLNICHPFQPFIHGQKIIGPKIAAKFGIKLVMYGENQAEYGNPLDQNKNPFMDLSFYTIDNPMDIMFGGISIKKIIDSTDFNFLDFNAYIPPKSKEILNKNIKVSYLGYFEKWDPQEVYYYSVDNTGFRPSFERSIGTYSRYTEIDDKIVPFHFYTTFIKFGIGRATYDAAQEIRNGKITREEGVMLVKKFDHEFPERYFQEFIDYINIDEKTFFETIDKFRSPHLWSKNNGKWKLKFKCHK